MQNTISQALTQEQERLATILSQYLSGSDKENLNQLLEDSPGLYEITQLKRDPKDFSVSEIKREIQRGDQIRNLYHLADKLLPNLDISNESIKYYASLVNYYSVYKLKRFNESTTYVYLLCFVYHRYQILHDNLIQCFLHHVRQFREAAREEGKEQVYQQQRRATRSWIKQRKCSNSLPIPALPDRRPSTKCEPKPSGFWTRPKSILSPTISPPTSNSTKPPFNGHTSMTWRRSLNGICGPLMPRSIGRPRPGIVR